jgi:Zn-dependent metalloprotease
MKNRRFVFAIVGIYLLALGFVIGMLIDHVEFDESRSVLLRQLDEDTHRFHQRLIAIELEPAVAHAGTDVIGHELTHGVTQYENGLQYEGESGALNESISDVFGAVFNQWLNEWPTNDAKGWLIGAGIMGPQARAKGKTCLRDMVNPSAAHCLSPQPDSYKNFDPSADVHENSGIPNKAFAQFAQGVGGNAWDRAIKVWYRACTDRRLSSTAMFVDFARLTIDAAQKEGLAAPAQAAWQSVALPL